jgi:dTDP-4-dehydrorhamnose 3,5-epimerase-like enzyme
MTNEHNEPLIMGPRTQINMIDAVWVRQMHFHKAGDTEYGHQHSHNHMTLLAKGSLKVTVDGKESIFKAPHMIFIHKDCIHELVALEDDTLAYCVHAVRDKDTGEIIEGLGIPDGVVMEGLLAADLEK